MNRTKHLKSDCSRLPKPGRDGHMTPLITVGAVGSLLKRRSAPPSH